MGAAVLGSGDVVTRDGFEATPQQTDGSSEGLAARDFPRFCLLSFTGGLDLVMIRGQLLPFGSF
jgi:hypothetical protein